MGESAVMNKASILESLTEAQKKVYEAIKSFKTEHGYPPTVREIGKMVGGKTPGAIQGILRRLELKHAIKRQVGLARSIQLIEEESVFGCSDSQAAVSAYYIPEMESDESGEQSIKQFHPISSVMVGGEQDCFMLQGNTVEGNKENDLLIVKPGELKNNDIAVVSYKNDILLRHYFENQEKGAEFKADPASDKGESFEQDQLKVLGKLVGKYTRCSAE